MAGIIAGIIAVVVSFTMSVFAYVIRKNDAVQKFKCFKCELYREKLKADINKSEWFVERRKEFEEFSNAPIVKEMLLSERTCEAVPLSKLISLLENGWIVYDVQLHDDPDGCKTLTLIKP